MRKVVAILLTVSCSLFLISCGASNDTVKEDAKREGTFIEKLEDGTGEIYSDGDKGEIADLLLNYKSLAFDEGYESKIAEIIDINGAKELSKEVIEKVNSKMEDSFVLLKDGAREEYIKNYKLAVLSGINKALSSTKVNKYEFIDDNTIKMNISGKGIDWASYKTVVNDYIDKNIDELNPGPVGQEDIINYALGVRTKVVKSPGDFGAKLHSFDMDLVFVCKNGKWKLNDKSQEAYKDNIIYYGE
ncbi:MAG: hypothetical protein PUE01_07020 [Clostridiaceae bacterium]|nr:hypothetical protein [Clostridiaceae bacterium]